jgi:hypothetical protein
MSETTTTPEVDYLKLAKVNGQLADQIAAEQGGFLTDDQMSAMGAYISSLALIDIAQSLRKVGALLERTQTGILMPPQDWEQPPASEADHA